MVLTDDTNFSCDRTSSKATSRETWQGASAPTGMSKSHSY